MVDRSPRPTLEHAVSAFAAWREVYAGLVRLDISPLVENGNSVTLTVEVDSPMTERCHVRRIALFNEKNPQAEIAIFHLSPRNGASKISTRVRLADSQKIVAVAELSDGSHWQATASVIVTLPACLENETAP
jgi:sulfur-oxidizing protein SoxY